MQENSKIQRKKSVVARRAWDILCMALLWARKGGIFKKRLLIDHLSLLLKYMKSLRYTNDYRYSGGALHYGERELSFDDIPIIHVKMHCPASLHFKTPNIPCIKPQVNFDNDHDLDDEMYHGNMMIMMKRMK
ncbi:putative RAN GTPase-activating protein 2-like isoform 1 [Capsicum annuum]|nr:putative RAN GTPase-activating protein 2-like isoform 1 [Capsicum annuum]